MKSKSLVNRHNPQKRIACANGFCKRRWIKNATSAEAVGLLSDNIKLAEEVLYINFRRHSQGTLEAKDGERDIPLVDASVWVHKHVNLSFANVSLKFGLCLLET